MVLIFKVQICGLYKKTVSHLKSGSLQLLPESNNFNMSPVHFFSVLSSWNGKDGMGLHARCVDVLWNNFLFSTSVQSRSSIRQPSLLLFGSSVAGRKRERESVNQLKDTHDRSERVAQRRVFSSTKEKVREQGRENECWGRKEGGSREK